MRRESSVDLPLQCFQEDSITVSFPARTPRLIPLSNISYETFWYHCPSGIQQRETIVARAILSFKFVKQSQRASRLKHIFRFQS